VRLQLSRLTGLLWPRFHWLVAFTEKKNLATLDHFRSL
jgi:hypothetical protein